MGYNQFCPIAKALETLGEKWTLLIVRELLLGCTRFNQFQRGLPAISPTLLSKRLQALEAHGLVLRKHIPGQRGYEYFPTEACQELFPVVEHIGVWGKRWMSQFVTDDDYDVSLLMTYLERSIQPDKLAGQETVIRFHFTDARDYPNWWVIVSGDDVDVCIQDPDKDVDVYFHVSVRVMCQLWMGDISYKRAIAEDKLKLVGPRVLTRNVERWLKPSIFAGEEPASAIMEPL